MREFENTEGQGEAVNVPEKDIVDIDRVIFKEVNDDEFYVINKIKSEKTVKKYFSRMIVSAMVIIAVFVIQCLGHISYKYNFTDVAKDSSIVVEAVKKNLIWVVAAFIIYNTVSFFFSFVKRQLVCLTENYFILLEATVSDKFLGKKIHAEGKGRNKNYITFECDQGVCSKAIQVTKEQYRSTSVGQNIVILKSVTAEGYTLNYLSEHDYRNIYDTIIKNAQGAKRVL